jgi:predicted phosphate transport protein (TIGR00153 family)
MFKSLLPKEYNFYDYFDNHITLCTEASKEFVELSGNFSKFDESAKKIKSLERQMDAITQQCTEALLYTFITPFERTDIHRLINKMDDIADGINSSLSRMKLYNLGSFKPEVKPMAELIHKSVLELNQAIHSLRNVKNPESIKVNCNNVRQFEKEADEIYRTSIAKLFETTDVIELIKWKEIFDRLEKIMDKTEDVAGIILRIVIESA